MAKQPSFQFYPGDWQKDPALQSCSAAAKGAFMDLLCYAFECEPRGCLITNGEPWSIKKCAKMTLVKPKTVLELVAALVLRRSARRGILFSARMVRDERLRRQKRRSGRHGGLAKAKQNSSTTPSKPLAEGLAKPYTSSSSSSSDIKRVSKDTLSATSPKPRKADPIWDAVVSTWFPNLGKTVPKTTATRIGRVVRDMKAFTDCTPAEIATRRKRMVREFGEMGDTPESLAKHWAKFGRGGKDFVEWSPDA